MISNTIGAGHEGNSVLLAEIETLKDKVSSWFKIGQITEEQLTECMRLLAYQESRHLDIDYVRDGEVRQEPILTSPLLNPHLSYVGHSISRGKAWARLQRKISTIVHESNLNITNAKQEIN